jgi:hypothetical protein
MSDNYQWRILIGLLKPITYSRWVKRPLITPLEFGFIWSGYEPRPDEFLSKVVEELQTILYHIKPASFRNMYSSEGFIKSVRELFPNIKGEAEVIEKILQQAQALLDCLEVINRGMKAIPKEYNACFSIDQDTLKEKLWRFDYLVHWAKADLQHSLPAEISMLDNNFNIKEELAAHFGQTIKHKFSESELIIDEWFNLKLCRAPKLKALIETYIKEEELCKKKYKQKVFNRQNQRASKS